MVGFGGGSSYIAVMVLFGVPYGQIPPVALICNLMVVSGGSYHFIRQGHLPWRTFWPLAAGSVPLAFVGGRLPIGRDLFLLVLGVALTLAGLRLLLLHRRAMPTAAEPPPAAVGAAVGAALGLLSGIVGIGGGIFLAPLMLNLRWGLPKQVAATCSLFILVNSLSGLAGQFAKLGAQLDVLTLWPLVLAVAVGGQLGSRLGARGLSQRWVRTLTGLLVFTVGLRVLVQWWLVGSA